MAWQLHGSLGNCFTKSDKINFDFFKPLADYKQLKGSNLFIAVVRADVRTIRLIPAGAPCFTNHHLLHQTAPI